MASKKLSICLIIKDEHEYLSEWLEWHAEQGADHFYIYDNGSCPPIETAITAALRSRCTVVPFSSRSFRTQIAAYRHCLEHFAEDSEWMAFIDTDEFIRPIAFHGIPEFLDGLPEDADAVLLRWIVYGADGQVRKRTAPVRERFRIPVDYPAWWPMCKSIIRPARVHGMDVHVPVQTDRELKIVNEYGKPLASMRDSDLTAETIAIDHYFTRSLEEWREKMKRGSVDGICQRDYRLFFRLNPDMKEEG